jgi:hypothetical protein
MHCRAVDVKEADRIAFELRPLDVSSRNKPHVVAQFADLAALKMPATTSVHGNYARRQSSEKLKNLISSQLLAQHRST